MKYSIFTTITNPKIRQDCYIEAINNYCDFVDEIIVVDGGSTDGSLEEIKKISTKIKLVNFVWKEEKGLLNYPKMFNLGLKSCTGDWAIRADIDWFFHEKDFSDIKNRLVTHHSEAPVVTIQQFNVLLHNVYYPKANKTIIFNKKKFGNKYCFGRSYETFNSIDHAIEIDKIDKNGLPAGHFRQEKYGRLGQAFYNYSRIFKTKERIITELLILSKQYFITWGVVKFGETREDCWKSFTRQNLSRLSRSTGILALSDHPRHIRSRIKNITDKQFGYSGFNLLKKYEHKRKI